MIRDFTRSIAVIALVFSAACGDDDNGTGPGNIRGTYTLRTIDGETLPYIVDQEPGYKLEAVSGALTINSGNTFTETGTTRETITDQQPRSYTYTCTGTYTQSNNTLTLVETPSGECGLTYTGTVRTNAITVDFGGLLAVYRK